MVQNNQCQCGYGSRAEHTSSPERVDVDQLLVVVRPAIEWALARGTNLNEIEIEIELTNRSISYLDGLVSLAGSTDVMTVDTAVDPQILLVLDKTNLRNKTFREFVCKVKLNIYRTLGDLLLFSMACSTSSWPILAILCRVFPLLSLVLRPSPPWDA